jgi:hypothetical protein
MLHRKERAIGRRDIFTRINEMVGFLQGLGICVRSTIEKRQT